MPSDPDIKGFMWATVYDNKDPLGLGRVLVTVPGLWDAPHHPHWIYPAGWPASGGGNWGARYTQPIGSQVALIFELGDIESTPIYLPGMNGQSEDGLPSGPQTVKELYRDEGKEAVLDVQTIWEDDILRCYIITQDDNGEPSNRQFIVVDKRSGTHIALNATDGGQNRSGTITLHATTSIDIKSLGTVSIEGAQVTIQGRPVAIKPTGTI